MNVQPVSMIKSLNYSSKLQNNHKADLAQKPDCVTFTSYTGILEGMTKATFDRESHVEKWFGNLMNALWTDNRMVTNETFSNITDIYIKKGLRGMLMEFWKANPSKEVKNITDQFGAKTTLTLGTLKANNSINVLGTNVDFSQKIPVIKLGNLGKHGFFNSLFEKETAPNDIRLLFSNCNAIDANPITLKNDRDFISKMNSVELYLDKKGDLTVEQQHGETNVITHFHSLTGHKKLVIESYGDGKPESTYYNKDGTKAFWKNFFYGGVPTEGIY